MQPFLSQLMKLLKVRSIHRRSSIKTAVLANLKKSTGKPTVTPAQVFSREFSEIFKNTIFTEHFWANASGK